jgi:predicted nucleotidyltransferase
MQYGLKKETIEKVRRVFTSFDEIEEAILYGSRAKGNFKSGSDIDLTLKGEGLNLKILNEISLALDDLMLPYIFDLSIYHQIKDPDLIEHIDRVGRVFFSKKALCA